MNSTTAKSGEAVLDTADIRQAAVVLWQEHHLRHAGCCEARQRLRKVHWHGHLEPAIPTAAKGTRGGVAISSKVWLGLEAPFELPP